MPRKKVTANAAVVSQGGRGTVSVRMNDVEQRHIDAAACLDGVSRGQVMLRASLAEADRILAKAGTIR